MLLTLAANSTLPFRFFLGESRVISDPVGVWKLNLCFAVPAENHTQRIGGEEANAYNLATKTVGTRIQGRMGFLAGCH
jgi:hypothetical protein